MASGNTATTDSATGWMTSWYSAVAPANAVSAQGYLLVDNVAMGETHLIDRIGLVAGNVTETWTDPAPLAGAATYHVVAYNGTSGDNSAVAPVTVQ